jgi:hypothetical protein
MALIALFAPMARSTNRSTHSMVITGCQLQNVIADSAACCYGPGQVQVDRLVGDKAEDTAIELPSRQVPRHLHSADDAGRQWPCCLFDGV